MDQLRREMGEIRQTLLTLVTDLGHIRVEVAKTQGQTNVIEGKGLIVWGLIVAILAIVGPVVMNRVFPTPPPQVILQQAPAPPPVVVPAAPTRR